MITTDVQPYRRYRVTLLYDMKGTDDELLAQWEQTGVPEHLRTYLGGGAFSFPVPKKITPAGTVYEGVASDVEEDSFFDLNLDNGEAIGFNMSDPGIVIVEVPA